MSCELRAKVQIGRRPVQKWKGVRGRSPRGDKGTRWQGDMGYPEKGDRRKRSTEDGGQITDEGIRVGRGFAAPAWR